MFREVILLDIEVRPCCGDIEHPGYLLFHGMLRIMIDHASRFIDLSPLIKVKRSVMRHILNPFCVSLWASWAKDEHPVNLVPFCCNH